jgi:hypothetical protein
MGTEAPPSAQIREERMGFAYICTVPDGSENLLILQAIPRS